LPALNREFTRYTLASVATRGAKRATWRIDPSSW
jgi:hypothetical protein